MIDTHVIVAETSMTTKLSKLLTSLGDMIRGHIADSVNTLSLLNDVYSKHVSYLATGLSAQLQDCDSLIAEAHVIAIRAQSTTISSAEEDRLSLLRERLGYLGTTLIDFDSMLDKSSRNSTHEWHYFPDRLLIDVCNRVFKNVNDSLQYHTDWLDSFVPTVDMIVPPVNADVFSNMTTLRNDMARLSKCLSSYKEELKSFEDQMNRKFKTIFNNDVQYEPPVIIMRDFQVCRMLLDNITESYIANLSSKKWLAETFQKVKMLVTSSADRLYSDMEMSLFSKLSDVIDKQESGMVSFYIDLQQRVASLQRYMFANDTVLEEFMRRFSIWRMPTANFQISQVIQAPRGSER